MPTTVTKSIGSGGGRDYTTLQSWEDAAPANLVTSDQIWRGECYNDSEFFSSGQLLNISGSTTDSTRYKELTAAAGQSFQDNASVQTNALVYNQANGVGLRSSVGYNLGVAITENYTRTSRLQIKSASTTTEAFFVAATGSIHKDHIIESHTSGTARLTDAGQDSTYVNIVYLDIRGGTGHIVDVFISGTFINCTLATASDKTASTNGFRLQYNVSTTIKNCGVFGATNVASTTSGVTASNNYTDVSSPPSGWTNTAYSTSSGAKFQGILAASLDLRIQSGSSLLDVGSTESSYTTTDIAGTSRPQGSAWDVGVWEYVSGGGGGVSVSLTGSSFTSSVGTLTSAIAQTLTGSSSTTSTGSLKSLIAYTPSGNTFTASSGTIKSAITYTPSGQAITASAGTIKSAVSYTLNGTAVTASQGTITASTGGAVSVNLSGSSITVSPGTLVAAISNTLAGSSITSSAGTLVQTISQSLSGGSISATAGTLTSALARTLSGSSATFSTGTLSALTGSTITIKAGSWIRYRTI